MRHSDDFEAVQDLFCLLWKRHSVGRAIVDDEEYGAILHLEVCLYPCKPHIEGFTGRVGNKVSEIMHI